MLLRQKLNRVIVARRLIKSAIGYLFRHVFDDAQANKFKLAEELSAKVWSFFRSLARFLIIINCPCNISMSLSYRFGPGGPVANVRLGRPMRIIDPRPVKDRSRPYLRQPPFGSHHNGSRTTSGNTDDWFSANVGPRRVC
jgi:hypothetical protein